MDGVLLIDKPAGITSHDVVARVRRALGGRAHGPCGHARPVRDGPVAGARRARDEVAGPLMALPKRYETVAQLGAVSSTGDTEGEIIADRAPAARSAAAADGRGAPAPAGLLGGEDRGRARLQARAARRAARDARADRHGAPLRAAAGASPTREHPGLRARRLRDRMRLGHVRALADRRPRRRLLPGAAAHGDRPVRGARTPCCRRRAASAGTSRR